MDTNRENKITCVMLERPDGIRWAQETVVANHYLHQPVDSRCSVEGYAVTHSDIGRIGLFIFGRPEATVCRDWYGSVDDVRSGKREVTRWQVLNLARVWLSPDVQGGGKYYSPDLLPGFCDRKGMWHSTLASSAIRIAMQTIGFDYLVSRPPCFLDEPYEIKWLLSYCNTKLHRGVIYAAAGFELYRTNNNNIQTWRIRLPGLTREQDSKIRIASETSKRSQQFRARRAQMEFSL